MRVRQVTEREQFVALTTVPTGWLVIELRRRKLDPILAAVPTERLVAELARRRPVEEAHPEPLGSTVTTRKLPGLTIDLHERSMIWRGHEYRLGPRQLELLAALGNVWPRGLTYGRLAEAVWGESSASAINIARVTRRTIERHYPGLIAIKRRRGADLAIVRLALEETDKEES